MSKKDNVPSPRIGYGYGYVLSESCVDRINGSIFQVIDSLGLDEKQDEAAKGLIRRAVWDVFAEAVYITQERHNEIRELYWEKKKEAASQELPVSAI